MKQEIVSEETAVVFTKKLYRDKWMWLAGYPFSAIAMIFIANDNAISWLISIPSFYTDLLFAFAVTFLSGIYIKRITTWLDVKNSWHAGVKRRLNLQMIYGVLFPLLINMSLEVVYLFAINISLSESSIFYLELPLAFLFLVLANLFYTVQYLLYSKHIKTVTFALSKADVMLPDFITTQVGFTDKRIPVVDCAFIVSREKLLWLHTFDGEQYRLNGTVDNWEEKLERVNFFRLNRQFLVAHKAISSIEQTPTRKILVHLLQTTPDEVYVSKEKASLFQNWWRRGSPV